MIFPVPAGVLFMDVGAFLPGFNYGINLDNIASTISPDSLRVKFLRGGAPLNGVTYRTGATNSTIGSSLTGAVPMRFDPFDGGLTVRANLFNPGQDGVTKKFFGPGMIMSSTGSVSSTAVIIQAIDDMGPIDGLRFFWDSGAVFKQTGSFTLEATPRT